jgi:hypothetical protein
MASDLVAMKLHPPEPRSGVRRPRLTERLAGCMTAKVALVSAAPGFAKSTLVGEWLSSIARPELTAWLALDPGDNDSTRFWRYELRPWRLPDRKRVAKPPHYWNPPTLKFSTRSASCSTTSPTSNATCSCSTTCSSSNKARS